MSTIDRQMILQYLTDLWGSYVEDYRSLTPLAREQFLRRQGYRRFADLLAHFTAWWEMGMEAIETNRMDPGYRHAEVDVDAFNAATVERVREMNEEQIVRSFEATREKFIALVNRLSAEDFLDPRIVWQLEIELVGHLAEHAIKNDPAL